MKSEKKRGISLSQRRGGEFHSRYYAAPEHNKVLTVIINRRRTRAFDPLLAMKAGIVSLALIGVSRTESCNLRGDDTAVVHIGDGQNNRGLISALPNRPALFEAPDDGGVEVPRPRAFKRKESRLGTTESLRRRSVGKDVLREACEYDAQQAGCLPSELHPRSSLLLAKCVLGTTEFKISEKCERGILYW